VPVDEKKYFWDCLDSIMIQNCKNVETYLLIDKNIGLNQAEIFDYIDQALAKGIQERRLEKQKLRIPSYYSINKDDDSSEDEDDDEDEDKKKKKVKTVNKAFQKENIHFDYIEDFSKIVSHINSAIRTLNSEYIYILDGCDVFIDSDSLSTLINYLQSCEPSVKFVFSQGNACTYSLDIKCPIFDSFLSMLFMSKNEEAVANQLAQRLVPIFWSGCFRSSYFKEYGYFNEELFRIRGLDILLDAHVKKIRYQHINSSLINFRDDGIHFTEHIYDRAHLKEYKHDLIEIIKTRILAHQDHFTFSTVLNAKFAYKRKNNWSHYTFPQKLLFILTYSPIILVRKIKKYYFLPKQQTIPYVQQVLFGILCAACGILMRNRIFIPMHWFSDSIIAIGGLVCLFALFDSLKKLSLRTR
jgi:hypothetical protein